jgi:hypothetical protein
MNPSLDDSLFRVKRARQHIRTLTRLEKRITKFKPDELTIHPNTEPPVINADGNWEHFSDALELPDPLANSLWSVIVGEVVYNLRAALDYAVFSLAWLDSGRERKGTQFPICSCPEDWKQAVKKLRGVNITHRAQLKALQPFNGGAWLTVEHGSKPLPRSPTQTSTCDCIQPSPSTNCVG